MKAAQGVCLVVCLFAFGTPMIGVGPRAGEKGEKKAHLPWAVSAALRLEGKAQTEQLAALAQEYRDMEVKLIMELDKAPHVEEKCAVVFLMGWYRSVTCVPELARNVTLKYERTKPDDKKPLWGMYPVVEALSAIGKPAIRPMLQNIETGADGEFRRLSSEVIRQVEGKEVARFILELELKKPKTATGRKRLQEALDYVENKD